MKFLSGKISDRIESGEIPAEAVANNRVSSSDQVPPAGAVRHAEGHGLGRGATTDRSPRDNSSA